MTETAPGDAGEGGLQLHSVLAQAPQLHHLVLRAGSQQALVTVPGTAGHLRGTDIMESFFSILLT